MGKAKQESKLTYLPDAVPGYGRIKRGRGYFYTDSRGRRVTDSRKLARFNALVIPPAWKEVWISPSKKGHLQATGIDEEGRKQYIYHPEWTKERQQKKLERMVAFGDALPRIRRRINKDMQQKRPVKSKVTALALKIMEETLMRVGNEQYLHKYNSHGLTTLKKKHAKISEKTVVFRFRGKKGVQQEITVRNIRLASELLAMKKLLGPFLFQYIGDEGEGVRLHAPDINSCLQEYADLAFTSKDYRTWYAGLWAFQLLADRGDYLDQKECKSVILEVLDTVSQRLGNTRTVCKQYYVPDSLLNAYEDGSLLPYLKRGLNSKGRPIRKSAELQLLAFLRRAAKG